MARDTTESENWEAPIAVIWLDDLAHVIESRFILILCTHVMHRARVAWFSIGSSVIDSCHE